MRGENVFRSIVLVVICSTITGCHAPQEAPKELLIYCGITMIRPMTEIAEIIETQENCKIIVTKGGSGNLLKAININKVGDLYLPGSDSYIKKCVTDGLVTDTVFVGYNKAAIMVQKGNPKKITADLDNLTNKDYIVVIGNPNSGSIGRETKKILDKKGIFRAVEENVQQLTTDSKDLFFVLKDKQADVVINWYAVATWPENEPYVDVVPIAAEYASKNTLVIGLLSMSRYPDIARKIMDYAASEKGHRIFNKYGLYDVP